MDIRISVNVEDLGEVSGIVSKVQEIEKAHSVNCVLNVEVFKKSDLLNCLCDSCEPSDS